MRKVIIFILIICFFSGCVQKNINTGDAKEQQGKDTNDLLLEAYINDHYAKCLEFLQNGAEGRITLQSGYPILLDICQKYLDNIEYQEIVELLIFYIINRKDAFEDDISVIFSGQTVGSYLSRLASLELLHQLVEEEINIFSPYESYSNSYLYELALKFGGRSVKTDFFDNLNRYPDKKIIKERIEYLMDSEKKKRMELLLDAGANVTFVDDVSKGTIFHYFGWYPFEEDYTELLDRMIENGADLFKRDQNGESCINYIIDGWTLEHNSEAYLEYLISRGLEVTKYHLAILNSNLSRYRGGDLATDIGIQRLEKIRAILENALEASTN